MNSKPDYNPFDHKKNKRDQLRSNKPKPVKPTVESDFNPFLNKVIKTKQKVHTIKPLKKSQQKGWDMSKINPQPQVSASDKKAQQYLKRYQNAESKVSSLGDNYIINPKTARVVRKNTRTGKFVLKFLQTIT